jgi:hypothetical protein
MFTPIHPAPNIFVNNKTHKHDKLKKMLNTFPFITYVNNEKFTSILNHQINAAPQRYSTCLDK